MHRARLVSLITLLPLIVFLATLSLSPAIHAGKRCSSAAIDAWPADAALTVTSNASGGVDLSWSAYPSCAEGGFNSAGYDLYSGAIVQAPNSGTNRLLTGLNFSYTHLSGSTSTCYHVRAYSGRGGNGTYSDPLFSQSCDLTPPPPVAVINAPATAFFNNAFELSGVGSSGLDLTYAWSSPDSGVSFGTPSAEVTNVTVTGTGSDTYTFSLEVSNDYGIDSVNTTVSLSEISGSDNPPVVTINSLTANDFQASLEGSVSDIDLDLTSVTLAVSPSTGVVWNTSPDFQTGQIGEIISFTDEGTYTVTLSALDANNNSTSASQNIQIAEDPGTGVPGLSAKINTADSPDAPALSDRNCPAGIAAHRPPPMADYSLDWSSEFNGTIDDLRRYWNSEYAWGSDVITNNERQYYIDALSADAGLAQTWTPFEVLDGFLAIKVAPSDLAGFQPSEVANQDFVSGVLTSRVGVNASGQNTENREGNVLYGYFEVRAKMPRGRGLLPAFWMYPVQQRRRGNPEIDIFEYHSQSLSPPDGNGKRHWVTPWQYGQQYSFNTQFHTYHPSRGDSFQEYSTDKEAYSRAEAREITAQVYYASANTELCGNGGVFSPLTDSDGDTNLNLLDEDWAAVVDPDRNENGITDIDEWWTDFSENFHTYGVEWTPDEIIWYLDGLEVSRVVGSSNGLSPDEYDAVRNMTTKEMYLTLNVAVDGNWPVDVDETTNQHFDIDHDGDPSTPNVNEAVMLVDYVRVYSR